MRGRLCLQVVLLLAPQQAEQFVPQQALQPPAAPQLASEQLTAHDDAALVPNAHEFPQFSEHPICGLAVLSWQLHDPVCPRANPIPASSRTIETIDSFFIYTTLFIFMNVPRSQQLMITIAYDDLDLGKILWIFKLDTDPNRN
jgi:hypothetical protein